MVLELAEQDEIHRMAQSEDVKERWKAVWQLQDNFTILPEKEQAWADLHRLTQDKDSFVRNAAACALGSVILHVSNKEQASDDMIRLTHDRDGDVQWNAAKALGSAFPYIPNKEKAWANLVHLMNNADFYVRSKATEIVESVVSQLPNKEQASFDHHQLVKNQVKDVSNKLPDCAEIIRNRIEERIKELSSNSRTVFISYCHDHASREHKAWVRKFAQKLREANFDVVRDGDEIAYLKNKILKNERVNFVVDRNVDENLDFFTEYDKNAIISGIMSLIGSCKNVLLINTPAFCENIQAGDRRIPSTDFVTFTDTNTRYIFIEHQLILNNMNNFRIISILREGDQYVEGAENKVFPMIDFRNDEFFSESLEYLIHYLEEGHARHNNSEKVKSIIGIVKCDECDLKYPYSLPPPKVCNNCREIYENEKWPCPNCGYNKFAPFFIHEIDNVIFKCPHCGKGKLMLHKLP